jgi:cellobiose-specific phosphotransferase system component IIA
MRLCAVAVQLASQVRKVEQQVKKQKSLADQVTSLKDQIQSLNAARQKAQDNFTQQLQVRATGHWQPMPPQSVAASDQLIQQSVSAGQLQRLTDIVVTAMPAGDVHSLARLCCGLFLTLLLCNSQAKGKELLGLTDKLHACEAETGQLRKQASTLKGRLEAAQAKITQQTAALTSAHEAYTTLQVGPVSTAQVSQHFILVSAAAVLCFCRCTMHCF